jgi:FKBP-type peptidyl-prolyl cis-trans isomerase
MKKTVVLFTCLLMLASASFGQAKPASKAGAVEDTIQYSLGVYMMQQFFAKTGFKVNNPILFTKGINDYLENIKSNKKMMIDPATTQARLFQYQATYVNEKNKELERILFDKVRSEKGFQVLASGVYYSIQVPGSGLKPTAKDTVVLNIIITLPDGTEVENSNKTKSSYMALAGEMIPGLKDVLFRVGEGAIFRAIIPSAQAYGEAGTSSGGVAVIPPFSAVIYDVALVTVKKGK